MNLTYMRQSPQNLRNPRYFVVLDNRTKFRIKWLNITRKFRSKRGNRSNRHGTKSALRSWDRNSGIHWELLKPIPVSIQSHPLLILSCLLNARSLSSKLIQIQHLLEISSLDILALTETWTKQNQCLEVIKGTHSTICYNLVVEYRPDKTGGGIGIIHRDTLKVRKVDVGRHLTLEYLILELAGRSIISIMYCPPNSSILTFPEEFTDKYMGLLILGDFNVNMAEQGEPKSAAFLELLETYGLMQWVLDPTHQSGSLLDHVITRETSSIGLDKPVVLDLVLDHRLILFGIPKHQAPGKTTMVKVRKLNDISTQVIQQELSDVFKLCQETDDPNTYLEIENKAWSMALDRMAPEKESLKKDWKRLPWFRAEALVQKCLKRQMEARYIKSCTEQDKKAYQHAWNIYLYNMNRANCLYLNEAVEDTHGDQRKLSGLLDSLTKEPGGTQCHQALMHHLQKALHVFSRIKLKQYANLSILNTI